MPELREVFEMTTQQIEPELGAWRQQEHRQRRANRNRKAGAIGVVALIVVIVGVVIARSMGGSSTQPADPPSASATSFDPTVTAVANGFVQAYGDFDASGVMRSLADDAVIALDATSPEELPLLLSFWKATGYEQVLDGSCAVTGGTVAGTRVRCPFAFHALRSDEIGLGPYSGSYWDLTVRDGEIVMVSQYLEIETFSGEVWEPFLEWVSSAHPRDDEVMYTDGCCNFRLTPRSVRLWAEHTREYVREVVREN
jgi:hypothetical protein